MAAIKAYTDIEQSRKLAEILPIESADMWWREVTYGFYHIEAEIPKGWYNVPPKGIPCWSLAALLDILTEQDFIIKTIGNEFNIDIPIRHCKIWFPSLLDAAFEMVCWLKENDKN